MNKMLKHILLAVVAIILPQALLHAAEPAAVSDMLAYQGNFDPTTIFLHMDDDDDDPERAEMVQDIIEYAQTFLGRPYRHGAKGPKAFDCSGFTSYVFKNFDIQLSPASREQYKQGFDIEIDEVEPGDLLFFKGRNSTSNTVGHVALVVDVDDDGKVTFVHAALRGGIRHDVYPDGGYYSKRFIGAKRVIE